MHKHTEHVESPSFLLLARLKLVVLSYLTETVCYQTTQFVNKMVGSLSY